MLLTYILNWCSCKVVTILSDSMISYILIWNFSFLLLECISYFLATAVTEIAGLGLSPGSDFTGEYGQAGPILPIAVV